MHRLPDDSLAPQTSIVASLPRDALLILAAVSLLAALTMLRQAMAPLREVLRALAATAVTVLLVVIAFALVIGSLTLPR